MDNGATISQISSRRSFLNFRHLHSSLSGKLYKRLRCLNFSAYSVTDFPPWANWRNSTSLAYLTLSGKYSERNFPLNASQVIGSSRSFMMDFMLIHQCSASLMSMYTVKSNLFSAGHIFASKILSRFFSHWSVASGLVFPLNFIEWCFKKSSKLHSLTVGHGSGPNTGAATLFSSSYQRASICCLWASSTATLATSIYCITNYYY